MQDWDELTTVWHVWCADEYIVPADARTILHLGANIGAFALWATIHAPNSTIYSIEPFPDTFTSLQDNIRRNGLENRVHCYQAAVSDNDGETWFDATDGKRSYCRKIVTDNIETKAIKVPSMKLESLLQHFGLQEVDCVKLDIEGGEYAMFAATSVATLRRSKIYTLEYHDSKRAEQLWILFEQAGYKRVSFKDNGWSGLATYERID